MPLRWLFGGGRERASTWFRNLAVRGQRLGRSIISIAERGSDRASVRAFLYDASGEDHETDISDGTRLALTADQILWVEIAGRDQEAINRVAMTLGLGDDVIEALRGVTVPTLSNYGKCFHCSVIALRNPDWKKGGGPPVLASLSLDLLVGENWLILASDERLPFLEEFRARDRGETLIGKLSSGTLAAAILDRHLTAYLASLQALEDWLDVLDVRLLASKAPDRALLKNVVEGRRFVSRVRRNLAPQREVFYGLARPDFALVAGTEAGEAFRVLERRYDKVIEAVEHGRELVRGSFDLFSTRIAESTNTLIRRLTFVSIALGGIGAVAGIFGMNFKTPYTEAGTAGFWYVISVLLVIVLAGFAISRVRGWI